MRQQQSQMEQFLDGDAKSSSRKKGKVAPRKETAEKSASRDNKVQRKKDNSAKTDKDTKKKTEKKSATKK